MTTQTTPDDAKKTHIAVAPQLIDAVREDPEILAKLSRAQLTMVQDKLTRQYLENPDATVAQGAAVAETLRKTANLDPKEGRAGPGNGFSITINIPQTAGAPAAVIEGKAVRVDTATEAADNGSN